jgi:hypothetical protein
MSLERSGAAICMITGCDRPVRTRWRCHAHYVYLCRTGADSTKPIGGHRREFPQPRSVDDPGPRAQLDPSSPCILHEGRVTKDGYGIRGSTRLHVEAYEAEYGPVPAGHQVDHVCHSFDLECCGGPSCLHRRCKNPAHLEAVTPQENTLRSRGIPAINAHKTHCQNGHPFNDENTFIPKTGWRVCKPCRREWQREYRQRQREAAA